MANFNCAALTSGATLNGVTLTGATTFPGSGAITSGGSVGIGTTSPGYPLDVRGIISNSTSAYLSAGNYSDTGATVTVGDGQYGLSARGSVLYLWTGIGGGFQFGVGSTIQSTIASNGAYTQVSDARLKEGVKTIDGLDLVSKLHGVRFSWQESHKADIGLIAQEVEAVAPELVYSDKDGTKSVAYANLVAPLIEAVKSLKAANEKQAATLGEQRAELMRLQVQVSVLQRQMGVQVGRR
jgi:hypothetical protein